MMTALPDSRVRVTASHSSLLATGSIPVEGSSKKTTGGPPIRAMPALSFRLFPPLHKSDLCIIICSTRQSNTMWVPPTWSCGPVCQHEARAAATSGRSPHSQRRTSPVFLWAWHTYSESLFLSCGPARRQTEDSSQYAAAPEMTRERLTVRFHKFKIQDFVISKQKLEDLFIFIYLLNVPQDAVSIYEGITRCDSLVTCQHLKCCGFPCSIEAQKAKTLPLPHSEGQFVHGQDTLPAAVHLAGTDNRRASYFRADVNLNNEVCSYLAQLLQDERTSNHRLNNWLTLQNPLPLFGYIPVLGKERCILYERQLDTHKKKKRENVSWKYNIFQVYRNYFNNVYQRTACV